MATTRAPSQVGRAAQFSNADMLGKKSRERSLSQTKKGREIFPVLPSDGKRGKEKKERGGQSLWMEAIKDRSGPERS